MAHAAEKQMCLLMPECDFDVMLLLARSNELVQRLEPLGSADLKPLRTVLGNCRTHLERKLGATGASFGFTAWDDFAVDAAAASSRAA